MRQLILMALPLMAACAGPVPPVATFRDPAKPIYSSALFDPGRLPGRWQQAATLAAPGAPACGPAGVEIGPGGTVRGALCLNGRVQPVTGRLTPVGPGRLQSPSGEVWWVIWVDEGYRTLAIATPSGAFGFILDRSGGLPPDRLAAAAEIFDFNGHDPARLRRLP